MLRLDTLGGRRWLFKGDHKLRTFGILLTSPGIPLTSRGFWDSLGAEACKPLPGMNQLALPQRVIQNRSAWPARAASPPKALHILYTLSTRRRGPGVCGDRPFNGL